MATNNKITFRVDSKLDFTFMKMLVEMVHKSSVEKIGPIVSGCTPGKSFAFSFERVAGVIKYDSNKNSYIITGKKKKEYVLHKNLMNCIFPFKKSDSYTHETHVSVMKDNLDVLIRENKNGSNDVYIDIVKSLITKTRNELIRNRISELGSLLNKEITKTVYSFSDLTFETREGDVVHFNCSMN